VLADRQHRMVHDDIGPQAGRSQAGRLGGAGQHARGAPPHRLAERHQLAEPVPPGQDRPDLAHVEIERNERDAVSGR
jgi:hypothetical protein